MASDLYWGWVLNDCEDRGPKTENAARDWMKLTPNGIVLSLMQHNDNVSKVFLPFDYNNSFILHSPNKNNHPFYSFLYASI